MANCITFCTCCILGNNCKRNLIGLRYFLGGKAMLVQHTVTYKVAKIRVGGQVPLPFHSP